jgi:nitroimidazol reductase NimA-like FMN-containing flavoprotein (pyridoxamine 5'-phosphate oxidase superfamily)
VADASPHLPHWAAGTVAVLSTAGPRPHAIPVSTAVRAGEARALFALARRRESLARLRADPRVALTLLSAGVAVTVHGRARVLSDPIEPHGRVAAVELTVDAVQDHSQPTFAIDGALPWHWTDDGARDADAELRRALLALAERSGAPPPA